jgi:hypothetical protein
MMRLLLFEDEPEIWVSPKIAEEGLFRRNWGKQDSAG